VSVVAIACLLFRSVAGKQYIAALLAGNHATFFAGQVCACDLQNLPWFWAKKMMDVILRADTHAE
jgi:hypothetical protein